MANITDTVDIWGKNANCYAYAMNDKNPTSKSGKAGGTAVPGLSKGKGVYPSGHTDNYIKALKAGVVDDGAKLAGEDASKIPDPVKGHYLIAGFAQMMGFHFVRRDPHTRQWSWVDGNHSPVHDQVHDKKSGNSIKVTEAHMKQIFAGTNSGTSWKFDSMKFFAFFWVPDQGCKVYFS